MSQEVDANLPLWARELIAAHPGQDRCHKKLRALGTANKLSIAWNHDIVAQSCGASAAHEGAYAHSAYAKYHKDKLVEIWTAYNTSNKTTEDEIALGDALKAFSIEMARKDHPELWDLGERFEATHLNPEDYKIAAWYLAMYPVAPLDPSNNRPPGMTGYEGAFPIEQYQMKQVYVAAKHGLVMLELALRWMEQLIPSEIEKAKADYDLYSTYVPDDPKDPRYGHLPGYPDDVYNIAVAHSWGGKMTMREWKSAIAWRTIKTAMPLLGRDNEPKPGDPGYVPLPPLSDEDWAAMGAQGIQRGAD